MNVLLKNYSKKTVVNFICLNKEFVIVIVIVLSEDLCQEQIVQPETLEPRCHLCDKGFKTVRCLTKHKTLQHRSQHYTEEDDRFKRLSSFDGSREEQVSCLTLIKGFLFGNGKKVSHIMLRHSITQMFSKSKDIHTT